MGKVTRTPQAEESRLEIWSYVAEGKKGGADRLIKQVDERCEFYADSPLLGSICEELGEDIRRLQVGRYEVYYRPTADGILILLAGHSARDIQAVNRAAFEDKQDD